MASLLSRVALISALAMIAVVLAPGAAQAATTWTYPSAACPQSSTGLNNCINNVASPGDTIAVLAGTYHENGTTINQANITVTGPAKKGKCPIPSAVRINADQSGQGFLVTAGGATIQCLEIDHSGHGYAGIEDKGGYANLHVLNVIIIDSLYGVWTHNGASDGLQVTNSTVNGTDGEGIYVDNLSDNVNLSNDLVRNTKDICIYFSSGATNTTVQNNTLYVCDSNGIYLGGGGGPVSPNSITGNVIRVVDGIAIYADSSYTTINGNTIDTAKSGGIFIDQDHMTVTNNLLMGSISGYGISGDCAGSTHDTATISGNTLASKSGVGSDFICAWYTNAKVKNNTAKGFATGNGIQVGDSGNHMANAEISGNVLKGGALGRGISVYGDNPKVNGNSVANSIAEGLWIYCTGVCSTAQVKSNTQSGSPLGCEGIHVHVDAPGLTLSGNQTSFNTCFGIYFDSSVATSSAMITNNSASWNGYADEAYGGIMIMHGGGNVISGNKANNNGGEGIYIHTNGNSLSGNTTKRNVLHGVEIAAGNLNVVNANTSTSNGGDGFNNDGTNTTFTNNFAAGNNSDCTNDFGEGATTSGSLTTNTCADGNVFTNSTLLTDE